MAGGVEVGPFLQLVNHFFCLCTLLRRRIAKATGATVVLTLADMEGNETFDPSVLGQAEEVGTSQPVTQAIHASCLAAAALRR
jgi:hypothetical protein